MFLYAAGCSMTYGSELVHDNDLAVMADAALDNKRIEQAWPGLLSKLLDMDGHHNDGIGGASNGRIMRRTFHWIEKEWLDKGKDPRELFVVIGWSGIARTEYFIDNQYATMFPMLAPQKWHNKEFARFWKYISVEYRNEALLLWEKFRDQVMLTQTYLESHHIPYAMTHGLVSPMRVVKNYTRDHDPSAFATRVTDKNSLINRRRFLGWDRKDTGMHHFIHSMGVTDYGPNGHPLTDGHRVWADHLHGWITENNLVGSRG